MLRSFFVPLLYIVGFIISISSCSNGDMSGTKVLNVGEELWKESLPLKMGSRLYQLQGLKLFTWYEVKISYPASIPASFSIQLKKEDTDLENNRNRRLLNTEKLIFKTDNITSNQSKLYVLVSVEPEGFVAIPDVPERNDIIFNIVCDELLLGIPYKAWSVKAMVLLCLVLALIFPRFLPSNVFPRDESPRLSDQNVLKQS